jgi:hypothetical protein
MYSTPLRPAISPAHVSSVELPNGLIIPIPVTTTRFKLIVLFTTAFLDLVRSGDA